MNLKPVVDLQLSEESNNIREAILHVSNIDAEEPRLAFRLRFFMDREDGDRVTNSMWEISRDAGESFHGPYADGMMAVFSSYEDRLRAIQIEQEDAILRALRTGEVQRVAGSRLKSAPVALAA